MGFFSYPYLIRFDDTMAYGTHHYMTNFKFQCAARESMVFTKIIDDQKDWREELKNIVMLTQEGYTRNMTAVPVGEKVIIFMSFEDSSLSSLRLCFRVVNSHGQPVTCGFQRIVCVSSEHGGLVELPGVFKQFESEIQEQLTEPTFKDRILTGGRDANNVFSEEILELGSRLANLPERESYPKIVQLENTNSLVTHNPDLNKQYAI